jgi:hypothetical protein
MHTPFLKQIAELFYSRYGTDIQHLAFVFSNRRAGLFFRKYIAEATNRPVFAPAILSVNDLFQLFNPRRTVDSIRLLFMLYEEYIRHSGSDETFDDFFHWGAMIVNDFDEVDKYLIDARQLFTNIQDLNDIRQNFSFLSERQIQAIHAFWSTFQPESDDDSRQFFLRIWELLFPVYQSLHERLKSQGLAYEGMLRRDVVEHFDEYANSALNKYEKFVFVGLNALTEADRALLKLLQKRNKADFYWDYASPLLQDPDNKASFFMRDNVKLFPSEFELSEQTEEVETTQYVFPQIETIGVPSRIGQAKLLVSLLEELSSDDAIHTAIVLPDESLLMPVLNSIPENIKRINVTLGYSLNGTPVASLFDCMQALQKNLRRKDDAISFYHRDVIALLRHKYIASICRDVATPIIKNINTNNRIYVPAEQLAAHPLLTLVFSAPTSAAELSDYLLKILKTLNAHFSQDAEDGNSKHAIEQEFIYHYFTIVNRMSAMLHETKMSVSTETYFRLLKQMLDFLKLPFNGEPLSGLQVMGVLETRALDFDNVFFLSCNEGVFPSRTAANSFIPYNLRRGFGLPTQEEQDGVRAYNFYRLLSRSKRVVMLYDTRADGLQSGEMSRYILQLKYHYKLRINEKLAIYHIASSNAAPLSIPKGAEILAALAEYETVRALSATAINTFLDCPLRFYFSEIKGIRDEEEVSETLESDVFGTILHLVMEKIYKPLCGTIITADMLKTVAEERYLTVVIEQAFAEKYFHSGDVIRPLTGQTRLYGETIRRYVTKILKYDHSMTPFKYIRSEQRVEGSATLPDGRNIKLKGFIDRIDSKDGELRIVDYKSGTPKALKFSSVEALFTPSDNKRQSAVMQVFLYSRLFAEYPETRGLKIKPAVYYLRSICSDGDAYIPYVSCDTENGLDTVDDFSNFSAEFNKSLTDCLSRIFAPDIPFTQNRTPDRCKYCSFQNICG